MRTHQRQFLSLVFIGMPGKKSQNLKLLFKKQQLYGVFSYHASNQKINISNTFKGMQRVKSFLHKKNVKGLTIVIQNIIQISARNFYTSTLGCLKYTLNSFPNITCTQSFQNILINQNTTSSQIYQSSQVFESTLVR